jgi:hypothetical protein
MIAHGKQVMPPILLPEVGDKNASVRFKGCLQVELSAPQSIQWELQRRSQAGQYAFPITPSGVMPRDAVKLAQTA